MGKEEVSRRGNECVELVSYLALLVIIKTPARQNVERLIFSREENCYGFLVGLY